MKTLLKAMAAALILAATAHAGEKVNVSGASGIALNGYDPVAFFTEKKAVHGNPSISAKHEGATYLFASEADKKAFVAHPEKYVPQFGGYCAYGVAVGAVFPVDIETWQVRDGKLYLNLNPEILKEFNKDFAGNIAKAGENWPKVIAE
ncbi:YHS domain-containing (seleno)protein [Luteolibacter algae]|uniref:YHS domain-containing (Seleno)protein n=1 Tax=Luteolibacter algae TaxID=454151 RepID=A0ABW5D498_9BACT